MIERSTIAADQITSGTKYIGLEDITSGGEIVGASAVDCGELGSNKFTFDERHLLFGKLRPYLAKIARPNFAGICSTDILPIRPGPALDRNYLCHYLRTPKLVEMATTRSVGANLPRLSPAVLETFPVPLPPIEEQQRIAAILDKADELRAKRRAALTHLDSLTQSIFLDMVRSKAAASWPIVSIGDLAAPVPGSIRTGPFGSQLLHSEFVDSGIAVLGIDNVVENRFIAGRPRYISPEKYEGLRRYTVNPGDVLISIMGTCGRVAVAPPDLPLAINTKHLCCITTDRAVVSPEFLRAALLYDASVGAQLGSQARGAVMPGLNMNVIKQTRLVLPPLAEQSNLGQQLRQVDLTRSISSTAAEKLDQLASAMATAAFEVGL